MLGKMLGNAYKFFRKLLIILFVLVILGLGYLIYNLFFANNKSFKSKEKPVITWELQTRGKIVDTVWVYQFK